jgi:hypothetical protein
MGETHMTTPSSYSFSPLKNPKESEGPLPKIKVWTVRCKDCSHEHLLDFCCKIFCFNK